MCNKEEYVKTYNDTVQSIESIQYKILNELIQNREIERAFLKELDFYKDELFKSLKNEKDMILYIEKQNEKIIELESKYNNLRQSKLVKLVYKFWGIRKKLRLKRKQ